MEKKVIITINDEGYNVEISENTNVLESLGMLELARNTLLNGGRKEPESEIINEETHE